MTRKTSVLVEGVFDLAHVGHFNAFRKARALADVLVVGINSDESVRVAKGALPLFTSAERAEILESCKFVDRVITDLDYNVNFEWFSKTGIDYIAHGDDDVFVDGKDLYAPWKERGLFLSFTRTCGISTTTLLARVYTAACVLNRQPLPAVTPPLMSSMTIGTREVAQFACPLRTPTAKDTIVYVSGCFDVLHPGLVRQLKSAKKLGTYLVAGVFDDASCKLLNNHDCFPVLGLMERVLSVLGLKMVDDVVIGAPLDPSAVFLKERKVSIVVPREGGQDCSRIRSLGLAVREIPVSPSTAEVYSRVAERCPEESVLRIQRKTAHENSYYKTVECAEVRH